MTRSRHALRLPRRLSTALVSALLALGSLPTPAAVAGPPSQPAPAEGQIAGPTSPVAPAAGPESTPATEPPVAESGGTSRPSIVYEEAMAHANDRIDFTPGARVDVGFSPRAGDAWPIDGGAPKALPSGRAAGREIAKSGQGSRWAPIGDARGGVDTSPPAAPADPSVEPTPAIDAPIDASADPVESAPPAPRIQPDRRKRRLARRSPVSVRRKDRPARRAATFRRRRGHRRPEPSGCPARS